MSKLIRVMFAGVADSFSIKLRFFDLLPLIPNRKNRVESPYALVMYMSLARRASSGLFRQKERDQYF